MSLREEIDTLAANLAKRAADADTPIGAATDALKAIAAYYAVRVRADKHNGAGDDDGEEGFDFARGIIQPEEQNGNRTKVRSRHG